MLLMFPVGHWGGLRRIDITYSANAQNVNLFTACGSPSDPVEVHCTINAGVYIGSTSTGSYAFQVGTGWATGSLIYITNNGEIQGCAGSGGAGGSSFLRVDTTSAGKGGCGTITFSGQTASAGGNGSAGGPAFTANYACTITNNGAIRGGGGGGGGGGSGCGTKSGTEGFVVGGGGGGGGRGYNAGSGAGGGSATKVVNDPNGCFAAILNASGNTGAGGSATTNGGGGAGGYTGQGVGNADLHGGDAGAGGLGGMGGANGGGIYQPSGNGVTIVASAGGGTGGAAGACLTGNSNITWLATGTREGTIS